jgi:2-polyprenyl-3-methyl-5-hydroxy-6-metoxy-1,4-benzoquinol methylase
MREKKQATQLTSVFEEIVCPLCGAKTYSVIRPGQFPKKLSEEFLNQVYRSSSDQALFEQVVQCRRCGLVYLSPRLKSGLIIDAYADGEDQSFIAQDEMRVRTFTKALRALAARYQLPLSKKTKVLDIGCAGGAFLRAAKQLNLSAIGIEPNRWLSEYARTKHQLDVRPGVLADYTFDDNSFDLITLWDVIEHVPDPTAELKEIHRILKPDGLLVVNYPDYSSFPARVLGKKWPFWLSVHLTYYRPTTIRHHLTNCGFRTLKITPHWQTLELGYVLKRVTPYFGLAGSIKGLIETLGLGKAPLNYWIGQTKVIARNVK